jgi:hypothetical protein
MVNAKAAIALPTTAASPHSPGIWGRQVSILSPASRSPSSPTTFQEGHGYTPLSWISASPSSGKYPDRDPHGGFNPNFFFAPPDNPQRDIFNTDLNVAYGATPTHRRGPLHFIGQGGA